MKKVLIIAICVLMSVLLLPVSVLAEDTAGEDVAPADIYTNVLEDLQKDEKFNVANYPVIADDHSLKVIQIAESDAGELFVYVYQPSGTQEYRAELMNMRVTKGASSYFLQYTLEYLNSVDALYKYKVKDFAVSSSIARSYDISAILRRAIGDEENNGSNSVSYKAYEVNQLWTVVTVNGATAYEMTESVVVRITAKEVARMAPLIETNVNLFDLENSGVYSTQYHYVAFSCDHPMDKLVEARVVYKEARKYGYVSINLFTTALTQYITDSKDLGTKYATVRYDKAITASNGKTSYVWNQIESWESFSEKDIKNKDTIESKGLQWVLTFAESSFVCNDVNLLKAQFDHLEFSDISDVNILELHFELDGNSYSLGVVDNLQTPPDLDISTPGVEDSPNGSLFPDIKSDWDKFVASLREFFGEVWEIAKIVLIVLVCALGLVVIVLLFKPISFVVYWILWALFKILSAPVKLVKLIAEGKQR